MKKLFTIILAYTSLIGCAPSKAIKKEADNKFPHPFEYSIQDTVSGKQSELYIRAAQWMANNFKSSKDVLQLQDKEAGILIGKGNMTTHTAKDGLGKYFADDIIDFTITINVKDNKFRCKIGDFNHTGGSGLDVSLLSSTNVTAWSFGSLESESAPRQLWGTTDPKRYYDVKIGVERNCRLMLQSLKNAMNAKDNNW